MDELRAPDPARHLTSSGPERERDDMLQGVDYGPRTPNRCPPSRGRYLSGQTHYETPLRDRSPSRYHLRSASNTPPLFPASHGARTPREYTPSCDRYSSNQTRLDYEFETPSREQSARRYQLRSASKTPPNTLVEHTPQATRTSKSFQRPSRGTTSSAKSAPARPRKIQRSSGGVRTNTSRQRRIVEFQSPDSTAPSYDNPDRNTNLRGSPPHRDPRSQLAETYRGMCAPGLQFAANPPRLFTAQRQHKPVLWQFVSLFLHPDHWDMDDSAAQNRYAAFAFCKKCMVSIYYAPSNHKVSAHMAKFHRAEMVEYEQKRQENTERLARTVARGLEAVTAVRSITPAQQERVNMLLAQWIAAHFRPLVIVEDEGFLEFISYVTLELGCVSVDIPKRNQLRGHIVVFAGDLRIAVRHDIEASCFYFSITSDIWTARTAHSYISFTIHYVTEDFQLRNWTLEVTEIPGIHTGGVIAAKLTEMIDMWNLNRNECTRFVHDSGSNIVSAAELLNFENTPCIAHELHLVVSGALSKKKSSDTERPAWASLVDDEEDSTAIEYEGDDDLDENERSDMERLRDLAIDEVLEFADEVLVGLEKNAMETMREIVQSFRSLYVYFRRSAKARNRLVEIQNKSDSNSVAVNMIVDCPTRWNSCYDMLERCLKLQGALDGFFQHLHSADGHVEFKDMRNKLSKPKHKDWLSIDCMCLLLKQFARVSTMLGAQRYPSLPLVMSAITGVETVLQNKHLLDSKLNGAGSEAYVDEVRVLMTDVQTTILRVFQSRFGMLKDTDLTWIAYLDPRVAKTMNHVRPYERRQTDEKFVTAVVELANVTPSTPPPTQRFSTEQTRSPDYIGDAMFGPLQPSAASRTEQACSEEFGKYLAAAKALVISQEDRDKFDTLAWWRTNKSTYPNIARLARKWLGAVATSVPSERAFSTSGNIVTAKRSSLAPELVRDLVFIAENSRRLNK